MAKKLEGQIAIITGGSNGIGTGVCKALAMEGAIVVVNHSSGRSADRAQEVLNNIEAAGGKGIIYQCDVSKEEEVVKMFADVIQQFGTIDI